MHERLQNELRAILTHTLTTGETGHQELIAADRLDDDGHPLAALFRAWAASPDREQSQTWTFAVAELCTAPGSGMLVALAATDVGPPNVVEVTFGIEIPGSTGAGENGDEPGYRYWQRTSRPAGNRPTP